MGFEYIPLEKKQRLERILLNNMRERETDLREVLEAVNSERCYEDRMYRYYHQSFKVFDLQNATREMAGVTGCLAIYG